MEKVLAPLRARTPVPVLLSESMLTFCVIGALMASSVSARPSFTVRTGLALLNCRAVSVAAPVLMVGVVAKLLFVEVIGVALLRMSVLVATVGVPRVSEGLPVPPSLVKVRLARVCVGPVA